MKKLIAAALIAVMALTLSACNNPDNLPDDIIDCINNPDDESCQQAVDCAVTPNDPACDEEEVDCAVTPNDPACEEEEVDCVTNPNDPTCEQEVDCAVNPEDPSCPVECNTGYIEIGGVCVLVDNRTPAEIAADLIVANWDGTMDHVMTLMNSMDMSDGMTLTTEVNIDVTDEDGIDHVINMTMIDTTVYGEDNVIKREVYQNFDGEETEFVLIIEETDTGFIVYYDTTFLRSMILENDNGDVQEILDTLEANGTWFKFSFDDSLANLVEVEVLKQMVVAAFYNEFGDDVFVLLQDELEMELGILFDDYGFDLDEFMTYLIDEDFESAGMMLDNFDIEGLIYDLDQLHLVPEIISHIYDQELYYQTNFDPTFDAATEEAYLLANGTVAWLNQLTEDEVGYLIDAHFGEDAYDAYQAMLDGDFDHYLVMSFLNDYDVYMALQDLPNFDEDAFIATMDTLDYDAFYGEYVDVEALAMAIHDGQAAFDTFVAGLTMAPQTASILAHFSGLVDELNPYMDDLDALIADIEYGLENLNMFEQYFTAEYYLDLEFYGLTIEVSDDFEITTITEIDTTFTSQLFQDLLTDLYWYVDGFETFDLPYVDVFNCPTGEECDTFDEYPEIISVLEDLGPIYFLATYAPLQADEMSLQIQFNEFVQALVDMDGTPATINDFSITITVSEDAEVVVPTTDITDVNMLAEEFAKFTLIMEAYEYLENIADYYMVYPSDAALAVLEGQISLSDLEPYVGLSLAFDPDLSYVVVSVPNPLNPMSYDFAIQLYWLDGTPVFTDPVGLQELLLVVGPGTGAPDHDDFVMYVGKVDEANFNMTKLFLVYMWEQYAEYPYVPF